MGPLAAAVPQRQPYHNNNNNNNNNKAKFVFVLLSVLHFPLYLAFPPKMGHFLYFMHEHPCGF
jgi:hypothetical protein